MDFYFVKRNIITLLHRKRSFDLGKLSLRNLNNLNNEIPDGALVGDRCLFSETNPTKNSWTYAKVIWQDFDLVKYNEIHSNQFLIHEFGSKYYLFHPFDGSFDELENTFQTLLDFAHENEITLKGGLIIISEEITNDESKEKSLEMDIFIPVISSIPKELLKQYLPYRIRRKKYNFYTY